MCMDDMHTSTKSASFLRCGHAMHTRCLNKYLRNNNIACPMCKKSVVDPKVFEAQMDAYIASMPMPPDYKDVKMRIMCNDCLAKSIVPFHFDGGKCHSCKSYNTTRIEEGEALAADQAAEEEEGEDELYDCEEGEN